MIVVGHKKPVVMEVIGLKGEKVATYVDKGNKKKPNYYELVESISL